MAIIAALAAIFFIYYQHAAILEKDSFIAFFYQYVLMDMSLETIMCYCFTNLLYIGVGC
jgi:hypothetical protein